MADTRYMDCPKCGRANVVGYKKSTSEEKFVKGYGAGAGTLIGAALGGPFGAAIGFAVGKFGGDMAADATGGSYIRFKFQCPACGKMWEELFPNPNK